jgi:hypothetical protein
MKMKNKIIITSLLLVFFFTSSSISLTNTFGLKDDGLTTEISCAGTDVFVEDFFTTTFEDPVTTASGWGDGVLTNARDFSWALLDYYATPYEARSVDVQGRKAYVAQYHPYSTDHTIGCYDINEPTNIRLLSERNSLTRTLTFEVDGDVGYTGRYDNGVQSFNTYNVSNPVGFAAGGAYTFGLAQDGYVTDIDPEGPIIFYTVFNSASGYSLRAAIVEDPTIVTPISPSWFYDKALGLEVEGGLAYVAASIDGLYILNVSSKYTMAEVGHVYLPGNATDVILDGRFAYVACGDAGVALVDIRDPTSPKLEDVYDTDGIARRLVLQGNTLFVADGPGGVCVLDVASHKFLSFVSIMPMPFVWDVDLYGGVLVAVSNDGIYTYKIYPGAGILDFSDSYYINTWDDLQVWDVRVVGDIAYVAGGPDGFYTLNVRDPNNPILLDHTDPPGFYRKLDVQGSYAHVITDDLWQIYDISDPTNIRQEKLIYTNDVLDIFLQGDIAYLTWQLGSYVAVNVSLVHSWYVVDEPLINRNVTAIWVQGPHVYVVTASEAMESNIFIYQKTDLLNQEYAANLVSWGRYYDIKVDGDWGYASDRDWLVVFNFTDPYNPVWINDVGLPAYIKSYGVWNFGPYIMNAGGTDGVHLVDATDAPLYTGTNYADATGALQITSCGDYTYVANMSSLVILRHFESAGDTYIPGTVLAQSTNYTYVEGKKVYIVNATLKPTMLNPQGCTIDYYMSNDGGTNWELVTPNVCHTFVNNGKELLWRAEFSGQRDRSIHLSNIEIEYSFEKVSGASMEFLPVGLALIMLSIFVSAFYVPKKKLKK